MPNLIDLFLKYKDHKKTLRIYEEYRDFINDVSKKTLTKETLEKLWTQAETPVAGAKVPQGRLSNEQFNGNEDFLYNITKEVKESNDLNEYQRLNSKFNNHKGFKIKFTYLFNRTYCSFYSDFLLSIPSNNRFKEIYTFFNENYNLKLNRLKNNYDWLISNKNLKSALCKHKPKSWPDDKIDFSLWINVAVWVINDMESVASIADKGFDMLENNNKENIHIPLNQILYGPPGTGKTYNTIEAAVKAADPDFYDKNKEDRANLKEKYQKLVNEKRIRFVTFHQSYGYEEFVEGLKANTKEGEISYDVEAGIFRQICEQADEYIEDRPATEIHSFTSCWQIFVEKLAEKETLKIPMSQTSFNIFDFNENRIFFEKGNGKKDHTLSINTLKAIFDGSREYPSGLGVYYNPLVRYLKDLGGVETQPAKQRQNYVLIIDEINRGNISKIFGELITLIEPSKRKGENEALELTLPYSSNKPFSVPNNLHIIGTMNTADRSLAMMDTALRRRFDFVEMMPDPKLLNEVTVNGIDLEKLLITLNERIEILYDREHTLGHAFFINVTTFEELQTVFKNKIIPLLQEYFFDDWEKIRLVLGDNQKSNLDEQFIHVNKKTQTSLAGLFGDNFTQDEYGDDLIQYTINNAAFTREDAYLGIYDLKHQNENDKSSPNAQD